MRNRWIRRGALLSAYLVPFSLSAGTTTFFNSNQVSTLVATGVTSDTVSSEGYRFTVTRDKLFTGGVGLTNPIGRTVRVPWPQGLEAQAVTAGPAPGGAQIIIQRTDGLPFDLPAFTFKLLANTGGAGGSLEIMPLVDGEDAFNDPLAFDATGYAGNQFSYNATPNYLGSTARLTNYPVYKIKLYVDFAFMALTMAAATPNHAPTNIALDGLTVPENDPPGTTVGSFAAHDPDTGDTFTYALVNGAGDEDNALFSIMDNALLAEASFNYELQSTYHIRVEAQDQNGLATQKAFTIAVQDIVEPPPVLAEPQFTPDGVSFQWESLTNHTYTILVSTDLRAGFTVLESGIAADPPINYYTDLTPPEDGPRFWQLVTDP